jgi:hypothetical protein
VSLEDQTPFQTMTGLHGRQASELLQQFMVLMSRNRGEKQKLVHVR